ncbi:ribonuclease H-like domain-containing protein [Tanacetum coccineum]
MNGGNEEVGDIEESYGSGLNLVLGRRQSDGGMNQTQGCWWYESNTGVMVVFRWGDSGFEDDDDEQAGRSAAPASPNTNPAGPSILVSTSVPNDDSTRTKLEHGYWGVLSSSREHSRGLLLRCDSTGDLYPVTQQPSSTITFALLSLSPTTWHRRLGYLIEDVLCHLEPSCFISYNKTKLPALCHACQLGKYTRLPFYSFESNVGSVFDIIHSDL